MKKTKIKRILATVLSAAMVMGSMVVPALGAQESEGDALLEDDAVTEEAAVGTDGREDTDGADGKHTIFLVGDSTVCAFTDTYYLPRYGYGTQIYRYIDTEKYRINNLAMSGRSSKSFLTEANYAELKNEISEGDVLVIGFGHNDEKTEEARYTNPNGDVNTEGSFQKSLYDNYVKLAEDKKATAVLCTPIVRRNATGVLTDSNCHIVGDSGNYKGGDYAQAIRDLAAAKNVPLVDLTKITKDYYTEIGAGEPNTAYYDSKSVAGKEYFKKLVKGSVKDGDLNGTLYLHAWLSDSPSSVDNTHLNIYGASWVAYQFAMAVKETASPLAASVTATAENAPKMSEIFETNSDYKHVDYQVPTEASKIFNDYVTGKTVFHGTAFGNIGGSIVLADPDTGLPAIGEKTQLHTLETDKDGNCHMAATNSVGKIASNEEGMDMYFNQLPADAEFELTAKATVNRIDKNNQVAFGLIARDNILIDEYKKGFTGDQVVAGTLGNTAACNCFIRKDTILGGVDGKIKGDSITVEEGKTYDLKLTHSSDGYACQFDNYPVQTGGYDFALTFNDEDYQYVGMFVSREIDVTFSDVKLLVKNASGEFVERGSEKDTLSGNDLKGFKRVEKVTLSDPSDITVKVGETADLPTAVVDPADAILTDITWMTADVKVARADGGKVKGFGVGETVLTARAASGARAEIKVKVVDESEGGNGNGEGGSGSTVSGNAEQAAKEGKGSVEDTVSVNVTANGKKQVYSINVNPDASGKASEVVTLAKGSKVNLSGYDKKSGSTLSIGDKKIAAVNGKGVLTAKGAGQTVVTYTIASTGATVELKVNVIEPAVKKVLVSGNEVPGSKKLTATVAPGSKDIVIELNMPLNFKTAADGAGFEKLQIKNKGVLSSDVKIAPAADGDVHITASEALKKGTVSVPFSVNGKKFTAKIKVK